MGDRKARHGLTAAEVTHLAVWWDRIVKSSISVEFDCFDEFVLWTKKNGWEYGKKLTRKDLNGPYSPDNCQWREVPVNRATIENHKTMAKQWDDFITPIRERYAPELARIASSKRVFFQYEHPDLVREGIAFERSIS